MKRLLKRMMLGLLGIIILLLIASQLAVVQSFTAEETTRWLERKVGTRVKLEHF